MSKKCQNGTNSITNNANVNINEHSFKINEKLTTKVDIGVSNIKRWNSLKSFFSCKTDEDFTNILLDLAQEQTKRKSLNGNESPKLYQFNVEINVDDKISEELELQNDSSPPSPLHFIQEDPKENNVISKAEIEEETTFNNLTDNTAKISSDIEIENSFGNIKNDIVVIPSTEVKLEPNELIVKKDENLEKFSIKNDVIQTKTKSHGKLRQCKSKRKSKCQIDSAKLITNKSEEKKVKKKIDHDIRKAPELKVQNDSEENNILPENVNDKQRVAIKIKMCFNCDTRHVQELCPLHNALYVVIDSINVSKWQEDYQSIYNDDKSQTEQISNYSYAYLSLPNMLMLDNSDTSHGTSVFSKFEIKEFTQFGPLIGNVVKEVDISEDNSMRDLWEIYSESGNVYVNTENMEEANWIRFIRPASVREERNVAVVSRENKLYFVTTKLINRGEELLYWQDDTFKTNKKKMEKTTCGGCNITFTHPLYYRTHCSIFHDIRYSLTIRKYHCKICGAAVLGKENIMKHAAELHNGQGAYQCQFCKKFFLRLNYLEIHRTYGCSANPHRSRPLCDFCGRKFCQPQKLKVHIKRMHSDMSEVLKEFQCKNCLKILGSRAALQRHLKEVHHKQVDGAYACNRCGKLFQNKSNLKIHMLTHSGIKPFKCKEKNCMSAFTTKQCLQFHYKKVHGFTEDMMPKIERSVEYTFEAYSGGDDDNIIDKKLQQNDDETSDIEENSMDDKNLDDPPALHSPVPINSDHSTSTSPPTLEAYTNSTTVKVLSKGSKKWIGDPQPPPVPPLPPQQNDLYHIENRSQKLQEINLDVEESVTYEQNNTNLSTFNRRESTSASLLVEAALDSVCSEPNIDVDVGSTSNCTDTLNNLYTLSHSDNLPDVSYSHSIDMNETRDINLISPSVNDHISVTDDLSDDLRHSQNMGIDYSTFQQEDFTPENSPNRNNFRDYINVSPQDNCQSKNVSPVPSPPRYDFGHNVTTENLSSDDSNNGIGAQNLSLHNTSKDNIQLDLSIYKTPYNLETSNFQFRKDFRIKFDLEPERSNKDYILNVEDQKFIENDNQIDSNELNDKDFDNMHGNEIKDKDSDIDDVRNLSDIRNKFEIDMDMRTKNYETIENEIRCRTYDNVDEFRIKNYDIVSDSIEARTIEVRNKMYDGLLDSEFRTDRNFEPLVINSELQGLDMSARSYHNYSNLNRYHHLYPEVERPSVDLRLNYSPPPPSYTHADILRVVSIDSVDLSLRSQIANSRLLSEHTTNPHRLSIDQTRLLTTDLSTSRHINSETRLISDLGNRILSDHTTNRLLSNDQLSTNRLLSTDQRIISDDARLLSDQPRLLEQGRILGETRILPPATGTLSPVQYTGYSVSPTPYHPTALPPRPHNSSPVPPYHHYSAYY